MSARRAAASARCAAAAFVACLAIAGCRKRTPPVAGAASASAARTSAPPSPVPPLLSLAEAIAAVDLRVEAVRGVALPGDAVLARHRARIASHFGAGPLSLAFQVVAVEGGRAGVLLQAQRGQSRPLVVLLDGHGDAVWWKEHPTGGVTPGVSELVLTPGPGDHLCLAWCNAATDSVALRRWAEDGSAFADYDALHVDECDALSVLYWPRRGWVFAVAGPSAATLELFDENGGRRWGDEGVELPWTWDGAAPVSLALDTMDTVLLFRLGRSGGPGSNQYVFASRWSADGRPMWPGPLSLKRLPRGISDPRTRVVLRPGTESAVRAIVPMGSSGPAVSVEVLSDGTIVRARGG